MMSFLVNMPDMTEVPENLTINFLLISCPVPSWKTAPCALNIYSLWFIRAAMFIFRFNYQLQNVYLIYWRPMIISTNRRQKRLNFAFQRKTAKALVKILNILWLPTTMNRIQEQRIKNGDSESLDCDNVILQWRRNLIWTSNDVVCSSFHL